MTRPRPCSRTWSGRRRSTSRGSTRRRCSRPAPARPRNASAARSPRTATARSRLSTELVEDGLRRRHRLGRAALLPLRHRRRDAGGARRRLARVDARPERVRGGQLAARRRASSGSRWRGSLDLFGLPRGVGRRRSPPARRCANFTGARRRAALVGAAARRRRRRARARRACRGAGLLERLRRTRARPRRWRCSGSAAAASRVLRRDDAGPARRSTRSSASSRALDGAPAILIAQRGRGERRRLRPDRPRWPTSPSATAPGCTSTARSASSRGSRRDAAALAAGVERADSVISDGHKWLNVPYDCGFAFVRDPEPLRATFARSAAYLPGDDRRPTSASRRELAARAVARRVGDAARLRPLAATARWSSATSSSRSAWRGASTRRPSSSGSPTCRSTSSASATARPDCGDDELDELNRAARRGAPRGRPGLRRHDAVRRQGRVPPGDRQLADDEADVDLIADVVLELACARLGELLAHELADGRPVGAAGDLRHHVGHHPAEVAHARRAGLGDRVVDDLARARPRRAARA